MTKEDEEFLARLEKDAPELLRRGDSGRGL
jgi:hypothetical protein